MNNPAPESAVPLISVEALSKHFGVRRGLLGKTAATVKAVDQVSFQVHRGETLGLVGESGCGKTTLGRTLLRLSEPTSGRVVFDGVDLSQVDKPGLRRLRRRMQIVFQDPYASLNPRMTVANIIGEALRVHGLAHGRAYDKRLAELLDLVGLSNRYLGRYPHEFSGGQRQRIGIARALALEPELLVCDEAVSALDVSIQAQIINLLAELQHNLGLTYLFISHDLNVVRHLAHRIAVMYLGRIVELGPTASLFERPRHPYTQALVAANPIPDPDAPLDAQALQGEVPSPMNPPPGCHFHPRCPHAQAQCSTVAPGCTTHTTADLHHQVWCHLQDQSSG